MGTPILRRGWRRKKRRREVEATYKREARQAENSRLSLPFP
jgi:hypothetical protein